MKTTIFTTVAASIVAAIFGVSLATAATTDNHISDTDCIDCMECCESEGRPVSGMFFSTEFVVEEYEYDDGYCLLYDNADANLFNVEIFVSRDTYEAVVESIQNGRELVGSLILDNTHNGIEVFSIMLEPEYEMADASANL